MNLTANGISKEFPRKSGSSNRFTALHTLDLTLESGQLTVLTGRSGSGKSTLLHLLGSLLLPTTGRVMADETDLYALTDRERSAFRNRHIGIIPQGQTAIFSLTVLENVLLPLTLCGRAGAEDVTHARLLLEELDIAGLADCQPAELSGGELRRMAIARALLGKPEILLADEPTADLDKENTRTVLELLRRTAGEGHAVLMVTHEASAKPYADVLYTMQNGTITGGNAL